MWMLEPEKTWLGFGKPKKKGREDKKKRKHMTNNFNGGERDVTLDSLRPSGACPTQLAPSNVYERLGQRRAQGAVRSALARRVQVGKTQLYRAERC